LALSPILARSGNINVGRHHVFLYIFQRSFSFGSAQLTPSLLTYLGMILAQRNIFNERLCSGEVHCYRDKNHNSIVALQLGKQKKKVGISSRARTVKKDLLKSYFKALGSSDRGKYT
jgi:hypothetical protein